MQYRKECKWADCRLQGAMHFPYPVEVLFISYRYYRGVVPRVERSAPVHSSDRLQLLVSVRPLYDWTQRTGSNQMLGSDDILTNKNMDII